MRILNIPPFHYDENHAAEALPIIALPLNFLLCLGLIVACILGAVALVVAGVLAIPVHVCLWLVGFRGFIYLGSPNKWGNRDPEVEIKGALTRKRYNHGLRERLKA